MTDAEYLSWLQSASAIRCVLVEASVSVGGVETIRYLSSTNFTTEGTDTPPNTPYRAVVHGGVTITEKLSVTGDATLSFGDIELTNEDGSLDTWLNDIWNNRPVNLLLGDVRWPRAQFRQILSGTLAGISSRDRNTLNLDVRDKLQRLNTPMSENKLGGTTDNKDRIKPLCFGECHNVEPLLVDPAFLRYQLHDGPIERIIEVRDNGVPVAWVENLAMGTFTLATQPSGVITASVQGDKFGGVYRNTIGPLVERILTGYGKDTDRFTTADIDTINLAAFTAANPQYVGLYLPDRANVLQAAAELSSSVGAQPIMNGAGQMGLNKITLPAPGVGRTVGPEQMDAQSLRIVDRPDVQASIKIGYCKNWTVQTNLQTGIPEAHKNLFALEWLTSTADSAGVADAYKLAVEPVQIDTLLLTEAHALAEANRRLAMWSTQRTVYGYTGTPELMLEALGAPQTIMHSRYGLSAGKTGQIVAITRDWLACRIKLEVLV